MTAPCPLTYSWSRPGPERACLVLDGELDYDGSDLVLDEVVGFLEGNGHLTDTSVASREEQLDT